VTFILCVIQIHLYFLTAIRIHTRQQFLKLTVGLGLSLDLGLAVCVFCHFLRVVCSHFVRFSFFGTKPRDWLGRTSPKRPILCRTGRKNSNSSNAAAVQCSERASTSLSVDGVVACVYSRVTRLRGLHRSNVDAAICLSAWLDAMRLCRVHPGPGRTASVKFDSGGGCCCCSCKHRQQAGPASAAHDQAESTGRDTEQQRSHDSTAAVYIQQDVPDAVARVGPVNITMSMVGPR